jgi:hypothetical protein
MRIFTALISSIVLMSLAPSPGAGAKPASRVHATEDLADLASGTYSGDVISDARGSSRSDVTITVSKVGPDTVSVTSSYSRLPPFTTRLTRAMQTIQQIGTAHVFLLDLSRTPRHLDITNDDASWSGEKE